jgi:hypothetical protein
MRCSGKSSDSPAVVDDPRSEVYAAALAEYVVRHSPDDVAFTDRLCAEGDKTDAFTTAATRRTLEKSEW